MASERPIPVICVQTKLLAIIADTQQPVPYTNCTFERRSCWDLSFSMREYEHSASSQSALDNSVKDNTVISLLKRGFELMVGPSG
ncbi:hypothetical protein H6P81_017180 [Aristolochia fimbriata]|uniref:Uncharacterized protein n=1 Tax=Aristolochia fimbriata TaxID=158543 RepID=A0AAV7E0E1_ARIFI|nr:hypothetical protein H6P81_017180 [Aristolochia fimbriata]